MCACDEGAPCAAHRGTRHDPDYFHPQNERPLPGEAPAESEARVMFACTVDESGGLADGWPGPVPEREG